MEQILKYLRIIKDYFLVACIATLLIFIYFKNVKIENLNNEIAKKPKIELIYNNITDTIITEKITPVEIVKWRTKTITNTDTTYLPSKITNKDSLEIVEAYTRLYDKYANITLYDDVVRDDSTGYIRIKERIQYNSIFDRNVIFEARTPVVHHTTTKKIYTTSIVGGIEAGLGGVEVGAGLITKRNMFMKVSYNPYNKTIEGGVYFPIFNFKNK